MNQHLNKAPSAKVGAVLLLILSLAVVLWASDRMAAAWQFFAAESITQNMHKAGAVTDPGLDEAYMRLQKALARYPSNPDDLSLSGHLKELRAGQPAVVGREQRELLASAAGDYRQALQQRPRWPYGWASLLSSKDKLGQVDEEFVMAIHKATELGPWEPAVQIQVLRTGMRHWDELKRSERALVRSQMTGALSTQPREAFELARFYLRPDLICNAETGQPEIERWCGYFL